MEDDQRPCNFTPPDIVLEQLLAASGYSTLKEALERLIQTAKTSEGRLDLASKHIIILVLELCQSPFQLSAQHLCLSLKLVRNLCAGEIKNQDLFIERDGVGIILNIIYSLELTSGLESGLLRMALQVLGNVSLAGENHCLVVWSELFPHAFHDIARGVRSRETCDPLSMIIYVCTEGSNERVDELLADQGREIVIEIVRTVMTAGFEDVWVKLLLSRIFIEKSYLCSVFPQLYPFIRGENHDDNLSQIQHFGDEQAFLLSVLSETMNERVGENVVSNEFSSHIFGILRTAALIVDFNTRGKSPLPTGSADIDVVGYSLSILRDLSVFDGSIALDPEKKTDPVGTLVSAGIIKFLLALLRDLEPPAMIRKTLNQSTEGNRAGSQGSKCCPYKGFRRDVVAVLGNCSFCRKHVQDEIREQDGILLILQQCVIDEDNPFMKEWGMWSIRNILEGNRENLQLVGELELLQSVDTPEIAAIGLRVEVDPLTRRPKLVNAS